MTALSISSTSPTKKKKLKAKLFDRWSFDTKSMREELCSDYFALADNVQDDAIPFLQEMKNRHRKCPYWKLLKHYCPCALDHAVKRDKNNKKTFSKPSQKTLLANHSTTKSVHSFVCAVLKRLIPLELFGNKSNRKIFFRNIRGILHVQKYGEVSLDHLMKEIKISKMSWLSNYNCGGKREYLLKCVDFLVSRVVCPLIQSFFFTAESSYAKLKLFIFRKRVWHRLRQKAFVDFVKFCRLNIITQHKVYGLIKQRKCLGCTRINFVLKKTCLRPISNLSFREKGKTSINGQLKTLLVVLNFEKIRSKQSFGVTTMGMLDLHRKYRDYIMTIKREKIKRLYFVTADIEKCFDSIQPSVLLKVAISLMQSNSYVVNKYKRHFSRKDKAPHYFESVKTLKEIQHTYGNVEFISKRVVRKETLVKILEALLLNNVIKVGKVYYLQKKGIPQGSKISSVLCAAYLSHAEKTINITKGLHDVFLRIEDEYLFVSTMKSTAVLFLTDLMEHLPKFECNINMNKCQASFECQLGTSFGSLPKSCKIKFYGLFIDSINFSVSSDYSRYEGLRPSDVVSCRLHTNPGLVLRNTVVGSLYPKCNTILFDHHINSMNVIQSNVLQIFCLTAVKFHFLVTSLSQNNSVDRNPSFFLEIVLGLPAILHRHINGSLRKAIIEQGGKDIFQLSIEKVSGLCHNAFLYYLRKKGDLYHEMIPILEEKASHDKVISERFVRTAFEEISLK